MTSPLHPTSNPPLASRRRRTAATLVFLSVIAVSAGACSDDGAIEKQPTTTTRADDGADDGATTTTDAGPAPVVTDATPGAASLGDTITPDAGNGGYDVDHYDLDITVADDRTTITGIVTIEATATQSLSTFNLDFTGLTVDTVTVDDAKATVVAGDTELVVTPKAAIANGDEFTTVVTYSGEPQPVNDPSAPGTIGWLSADSGTFVASEPTGAKGFFPGNDHPSDKATFTIRVTASNDDTAVANGTLTSKEPADDDHTTWVFDQTDPMATYLVQIAVGDYEILESTGPHGLPIRHAVVSTVTEAEREVLDETADQIAFFEPLFGPFPLDNYGLLVADSRPEFALETQTLTLLPAEWLQSYGPEGTSAVMAHELAHQWFGDAVSPERWADIWLNEGFATYAEWLWDDHRGYSTLDSSVAIGMAQADRWRESFGPVAAPEPQFLFSPNVYDGAAVVLHALRLTVGDDVFFDILRTWTSENDGSTVTTDDLEALATRLSGQDLSSFFDAWVHSTTLPPMPG